jgi:PAS domain S-box-containing protein
MTKFRLLDDGLDEMAAGARTGLPPRLVAIVLVTMIAAVVLPLPVCFAWFAWVMSWDVASWFWTRPQQLGLAVSEPRRWLHVASILGGVCGWTALGVMLWTTGQPAAAFCAGVIWMAVMGFAQVHAYQSRSGYLLSGVIPAATALITPVAAPLVSSGHPWMAWSMLAVSVTFSISSAGQTSAARRRYEAVVAKVVESERDYRLLADNVTDVIALGSADHQRLYISPSIERVLGFSPAELLATPNYTYLHKDHAPNVVAFIDGVTEESGPQTMAYEVFRKDGTSIWAETTFSRVNDGSGRLLSVSRDVTARKALEDELKATAAHAEAAAAAKTDFLANMTHELRTPLTAILGFAGVLRQSKSLTKRDARHAQLIHDASQTLLGVVGDVLDFSKFEAGGFELDPQPFEPEAAVRAVVAIIVGQAEDKGLKLETVIEGAPPALVGDAPRLRQVLLNFLSNAVKFTREGAVTVRLSHQPADEGHRLRLEVSDTGIGVEAEHIGALFNRFTQADASVSRRFGGTGLGLAICKQIVEAMGGRIGADSRAGEGSTFWFEVTLPAAGDWTGEAAAAETVSLTLERPIRALVVEDNAVNRELIATLLSPFDIEIETACDGAEAVDAVAARPFDVILMDMQMPVMDGLTATRRIRALPDPAAAATPIIAMTANVLPEQVARCREAGMDDHLGKPINLPALLAALDHWATPRDDRQADAAEA